MDLGIGGRRAVVTGASRGIGAAVVRLLRAEGAQVVEVSRSGGIDVTAPDAAERLGEAPDILVNNAGTTPIRELEALEDGDWQEQWEISVMAPMRLMRAWVPVMAERGWGRVVNVASSAGKRPSGINAAYSVGKAALLSLSRVYADAYAGDGVAVNAVAPGVVEGSMWLAEGGLADQVAAAQGISREEALAGMRAKPPVGRAGTEEEVAAVIAFLCSERASYVAGAAWSVDGGSVPVIL
jgi:3-oxoacyl-[acyl-carrier protein] reductase